MRIDFDYGEMSIKFDLHDLPRASKLNLINTILHSADVELTKEQIEKLDKWVNIQKQN